MDYATLSKNKLPRKGVKRKLATGLFALLVLAFGFITVKHHLNTSTVTPAILSSTSSTVNPLLQTDKLLPNNAIASAASQLQIYSGIATAAPEVKPIIVAIRKNDSLPKVFKRLGIDTKDAKKILAMRAAQPLRTLQHGQKLSLILNPSDKSFKQLCFIIDETNTLTVTKSNVFQAKLVHVEPVQRLQYVASTIHGSMYTAGKRVGLSEKIVQQFTKVFNNKANFAKGIYKGDRFAVYYREYYVNNKKIREGDIAAAELIHAGKSYRVIGFTDPKGITNFYTPQGYGLVSPFLRYPVKFSGIGDRFSMARLEPILKIVRPHYGVDLKAPHGTPIQASSDGRIAFAGRRGGYGNAIIIEHGIYSTLYAHLSRFNKSIHSGSAVKQGQIIGFVGATGLATGPHLHYEFHINGVPHDPLKVALPSGEMIASVYRSKFFSFSRQMLAKLDLQHSVVVAMEQADSSNI